MLLDQSTVSIALFGYLPLKRYGGMFNIILFQAAKFNLVLVKSDSNQ